MYVTVLSNVYSTESRKLNLQKLRCARSIELFTDRIAKAKNLLLDEHIGYENYVEIKNDLEGKIRILGYSIDAYTSKQIELHNKIREDAQLISDLPKILELLDERNKPSFFSNMLVRGQVLGAGNSNFSFKEPFKIIYGLTKASDCAEIVDFKEVEATLQTIANLQILVTN